MMAKYLLLVVLVSSLTTGMANEEEWSEDISGFFKDFMEAYRAKNETAVANMATDDLLCMGPRGKTSLPFGRRDGAVGSPFLDNFGFKLIDFLSSYGNEAVIELLLVFYKAEVPIIGHALAVLTRSAEDSRKLQFDSLSWATYSREEWIASLRR